MMLKTHDVTEGGEMVHLEYFLFTSLTEKNLLFFYIRTLVSRNFEVVVIVIAIIIIVVVVVIIIVMERDVAPW